MAVSSTTRAEFAPARRQSAWARRLVAVWPWLFLILLVAFFEVWAQFRGQSFFFNVYNLQSIGRAAVIPLLLALGQTFVIISGGIDLSVGFTMGLSAVVMSRAIGLLDPALEPAALLVFGLAAAFLVAMIPGLTNGYLIAHLRVPAFIGTLGMYGIARGAGYLVAGGTTVPVRNDYLSWIGNGKLWGVPVPVIIAMVAVLVMHYVLSQTRFGQYTYAMGGNRQAALRAGIPVRRHTIKLYVIAALCAALAGIVYTAMFSAGAAQAGEPLLLDSIAAVVIGGASLFGGSGTILGTVIGALIIAVIRHGLVFINVEPFWQFVAVGVVIIISVLVDQSQARLMGGVREEE